MKSFSHPLNDEFSLATRFFDVLTIWLVLFFIRDLWGVTYFDGYLSASLLAGIFYLISAEVAAAFRYPRLGSYADMIEKIVLAWFLTCLLLIVSAALTKTSSDFSRLTVISWFLCTPIALIIERIILTKLLNYFYKYSNHSRTYLILGEANIAHDLPKKIEETTASKLIFLGQFSTIDELLTFTEKNTVDYIFLAYPSSDLNKINSAIKVLQDSTASIYLIPDLPLTDFLGSRWIMMGNTPLIIINDHPFYGGQWGLKKVEDLILGSIFFICFLPLMLLIAAFIKLTSPGPVLFTQRRHGLHGEVIKVYKFRTMTTLEDGDTVTQATKNDERVTPIGKFLRRTSLDELPQFMNVLKGDMSIVGPRPHALAHNEHYRKLIDGYMQRHKVKPGITGWAQINGLRGETDTLEKMRMRVEYDLYYINHWSLRLDIKIILLTAIKGLGGKAVY